MNAKFPKAVARIAEELVEVIQEGKLAILCGAGISIAPPSNLPSAKALRRAIIRKLIDVDSLDAETRMSLEDGVIKEKGIKASRADDKDRKLYYPFEAFIQAVDENAPILDTLVNIYKIGEPNKSHTLLAELMKKKYVRELLTTNFDTKIEEALEKPDVSGGGRWNRGVDFKVFSSESEFLNADFSGLKFPVILKVHGTIEDKDSIRATLETVSRRELREARTRVLRHFFQETEHDIFILGYSASDEFDINPVLRGLESEKRIFQIEHLGSDLKEKSGVFPLRDPFKAFKGKIIRCNTDDIIAFIWEKLVQKPWKEKKGSDDWKYLINDWGQSLPELNRTLTVAEILYQIQDYTWAENLYKQSLDISEKLGYQYGIAFSLRRLGRIQQEQGNYDEAEKLYNQSLTIRERMGDQPRIAILLSELANIPYLRGNYEEAEKLYNQSLKISERLGLQYGISTSLHQLAMIQEKRGNYEEAEKLYNQSLTIRERMGDQPGIASSLHQLANVQYLRGNYGEAEKLYKQSLDISEKLGLQYGIAISLHQLAMIQQERGNYEEAEKLYNQSLTIRERMGDQVGIAGSLHQLGRLQEKRGNYDEAERLYKKALELLRKVGEMRHEKLVMDSIYRVHRVRSGLIYRILSALKSKGKKK